MKLKWKAGAAALLSLSLAVSGVMPAAPVLRVDAQQAPGTAPFINTWLVSGPFDEPVVDQIYGTEEGLPMERPENGNWAAVAQLSASSVWQGGPYDFPDKTDFPSTFLPELTIDGDKSTMWLSQMHDSAGDPSTWPKWDPKPTLTMKWHNPITVKEVQFCNRHDFRWGDGDISRIDRVDVQLKDEEGNVLAEKTVEGREAIDYTGQIPASVMFDEAVSGVFQADLMIIHNGEKTLHNVGLGLSEVAVYDGDPIKGPEDPGMEYNVNIAPKATVNASSCYPNNPLSNLVDGSTKKQWVSLDGGQDKEPWVSLTWEKAVTFNEVSLAQWGDSRHVNNYYDLTVTLADGTVMEPVRVESTGGSPSEPTVYKYKGGYLKDVKSIKVDIDKGRSPYPGITGISEMEVYNRPVDATDLPPEGPDPEIQITPQLGQSLGGEAAGQAWEYFDDRLWNRNYDDYQDLNGYYSIKKGIDTRNKFVYAHTYVYSPERQWAQLRMGASGSYRAYLNDELLTNSSVPAEVQKDMSNLNVVLKKGWNKVMIQIEHTYTEDVNANGIPVAKDYDVSYLGFYGRITDVDGNELDGLEYSVNGGEEASLQIMTQSLSAEDITAEGVGLPENAMPFGYKEWPYVWNKSTTNNKYGLSASAFQFQAAGGSPGYTWEIIDGSLPDNLVLNEDGTIADGLVNGKADLNSDQGIIPASCKEGDYAFKVRVTDQEGKTAEKAFVITVKERPNKWFEEGRVGALSHCIPIVEWSIDPNFSFDSWAERAKHEGHSLVSIESVQQHYYWPSKFDDPENNRNRYYIDEATGKVKDGLKEASEAVKRYGIRFGLYYATQPTDVTVQDIGDLIGRYDPDYLYFDGPQFFTGINFDVVYSNIRNYSDEIIVNANAWGEEYGDPDLGTHESSGIYANVGQNHFVKKVVFEPWKSLHTKNNYTPYYARRDDYRLVSQEMVMNAGRGYVDNNDQMPLMSRGTNFDKPEDVSTRYPKSVQEFIDVREGLASWFAPEGKPERHESTTGTTPYYLSGYGFEDDGKGNYNNFAHPNADIGPRWGYAVSRDNNIYLHIMKGPDSKIGFEAISNHSLEIGPVTDTVTSVTWLNEDKAVAGFTQKDGRLTIDLSGVEADQVDTIIKITTDSAERKYQLTNLYLEGKQLAADSLQITVEGQMTYPALKAALSEVTFRSEDSTIASVNANGIVAPGANGTTGIVVTGTCEGVTVENTIKVTSKDGSIYVGEELLSAVLHVNDREMYGELNSNAAANLNIEGRAVVGGSIGLDTAEITWHTGTVDLAGGDNYTPVKIVDGDLLSIKDGKLCVAPVKEVTRTVVWADVTLDGKTLTTNRVYLDLLPYENFAQNAEMTEITTSVDEEALPYLTDGKKINGTDFDSLSWSANAGEESWIAFKFNGKQDISSVDINFNSLNQNYYNTPGRFEIQTSEDGEKWTVLTAQNGPTGGAYFGFYNTYEAVANTEYLRLYFPGSANGSRIDLMEVAVNGIGAIPVLSTIKAEPVVNEDNSEVSVEITGFTADGKVIDLAEAETAVKSDNEKVAAVDEKGVITPVAAGTSKITVTVKLGEITAEDSFDVMVDNAGKIHLMADMHKITIGEMEHGKVTVDKQQAEAGDTVTITMEPEEGYYLAEGSLKVSKADASAVELTDNEFLMPAEDVTITAAFLKQPADLEEVILKDGFEGEDHLVFIPSKDGIVQEVISLTEDNKPVDNKKGADAGSVSGSNASGMNATVSSNRTIETNGTVSGNASDGDAELDSGRELLGGAAANKVLYVKSPDGTIYLPTAEKWSNYIFECKVMITEWKGSAEGTKPWDNMAPAWYINPDNEMQRYALKYNREEEAFKLYKRYFNEEKDRVDDEDIINSKAPENYVGSWHDYKIVMDNGKITASVDGEVIFEHNDTSLTSGTIGFDGINVEYYLDDISVTRQKSEVPSADVLSGEFTDEFSVKLSHTQPGAVIVYTLDGSDPVVNGSIYDSEEGIAISDTAALKIAAMEDGKMYSDVVTYEYVKKEAPVTDKSELQKVYDQYKDLKQGNYTDDSWAEFVLARDGAKDILDAPDAAQDDINAAKISLEEAFKALEEKPAAGSSYRSLLQKTYDYAKDLSTEGVVDSAARKFQAALDKAKTLLANPETADAQLEEAFDELLEGIWSLGLIQGNKAELAFLIAKADLMVKDADKYVAVNWQLLLDELEDAREVMADGDAMVEDIKPAVDELLDAVLKQRFKARKDILEGILNKAAAVDESLYTKESVQVFRTAFAYAEKIMSDDTLSEDEQDKVNKAAEGLDNAILKLVKKDDTEEPADPIDPDAPADPDDPADSSNPSDDSNQPSDDGKEGTLEGSNDSADSTTTDSVQNTEVVSPKTGDYANLGLAALIAAFGLVCVGVVAVGKRKKED